jgi:hypothetical protein
VVAQRPRLFRSEDDHVAGALGKSLKHTKNDPTLVRCASPVWRRAAASGWEVGVVDFPGGSRAADASYGYGQMLPIGVYHH